MRHFLSAIQFLTILPVGGASSFEPARLLPYFPMVGLLLGLLVGCFDQLALHLWPASLAGVLGVLVLALLTGALHLDGLADTADGLYGKRSVESALTIMKDSRIGSIGATVLACCLIIKCTAAGHISSNRFLVWLLVPALARSGILLAVSHLPYGRSEGGTGGDFFCKKPSLADAWGVLPPLALSFWMGWQGIILIAACAGILLLTLAFYRRKLGCITGDMMGALIEVSETGLLLVAALTALR